MTCAPYGRRGRARGDANAGERGRESRRRGPAVPPLVGATHGARVQPELADGLERLLTGTLGEALNAGAVRLSGGRGIEPERGPVKDELIVDWARLAMDGLASVRALREARREPLGSGRHPPRSWRVSVPFGLETTRSRR